MLIQISLLSSGKGAMLTHVRISFVSSTMLSFKMLFHISLGNQFSTKLTWYYDMALFVCPKFKLICKSLATFFAGFGFMIGMLWVPIFKFIVYLMINICYGSKVVSLHYKVVSKMSQGGPKMVPKWSQNKCYQWSQGGPKVVPRWSQKVPKWSQRGHKISATNGPKVVSRWSQGGPKVFPRWSKSGPKAAPKMSGPKKVPKWSERGHKISATNGPKVVPMWSQGGPKVVPKWSQNGFASAVMTFFKLHRQPIK